jgi:Zn-dependent protease
MSAGNHDWTLRAINIIPMLLSLTVHEWAHAWSARRLGDDTAECMGRLTLDPFAHADLLGTFLLPLLNIPFGWAKPVPVDPTRFAVIATGGVLLAGPIGVVQGMLAKLIQTIVSA